MKVKLKQFRVAAGLTQARAAAAAGITQSTYQRWKAGSATVPYAKAVLICIFRVARTMIMVQNMALIKITSVSGFPDSRDWEIIEHLSSGDAEDEGFAEDDVERVRSMVMKTDEQYEALLAENVSGPKNLK